MFRKLIWGTGLLLVLGLATFGADLWSYVRTGVRWVTSSIRSQVPVQFELERATHLIQELSPEIESSMHAIAEEEVAIERMQAQIADLEARSAVQLRQMGKLRQALETGEAPVVLASGRYTPEAVRADLARRAEAYKRAVAAVQTQRRILAARQTALEAAQKKVANLLAAKRDLEAQVAELGAQLKMLEAVQAAGRVAVDDTRLAQAQESIRQLQHRLEVTRKLIEKDGLLSGGIPVEDPPPSDVLREVDALLAGAACQEGGARP